MNPTGHHAAPPGIDQRRLDRWERIGLGVRLAYHPGKPQLIRLWVALGERLAGDGAIEQLPMWRRTVRLLLQVAGDEALPLGWRCMALDHAARPAARLAAFIRRSNAGQAAEVGTALEQVRAVVDAAMARHLGRTKP
jgi:hypothetical protein